MIYALCGKIFVNQKYEQQLVEECERKLGIPLRVITEGRARIIVPRLEAFADEYGHIDPARAPVFYNPRMIPNRDLAVAAARTFHSCYWGKEMRICEPFCSTGVRGIRYALEGKNVELVIMGDIDRRAVSLASANVKLNEVEELTLVRHADANELLGEYVRKGERFSIVDVDPFGSPAQYVLDAARALLNKGMLAVTATDLPPLMGVYPLACRRKYSSIPIRVPYSPEVGLRILMGYIARELGKLEAGMKVLMGYYMDHYMRIYVLMERGATKADRTLNMIGYIQHCIGCGMRNVVHGLIPSSQSRCPRCGSKLLNAGPLWLGPICDPEFVEHLTMEIMLDEYASSRRRLLRLLSILREEAGLQLPYYYTVSEIAQRAGTCEVSPRKLVVALRELGYKACQTHFDPKGVKTNADLEALVKISRTLVREIFGSS